jgi:GR25 family glycosyltransferase involved in LPS biosynthesis
MIDIFNIPLYYISFKTESNLEKNLLDVGFKNINHFQAVDGRNFKPNDLIDKNLITIRSYNDLVSKRHQHSGLPSLGAVGCTMSHNELWKLCVEKSLPYICIAEADLYIDKITLKNKKKIQTILEKPNSVFVSANINSKKIFKFMGTHFCIISLSACKELIKEAFPIDVQTDSYISHMDTIKKINLGGFPIGKQKIHISSIQELCVKCNLPTNTFFYIVFFLKAISILVVLIFIILLCLNYNFCTNNIQK